MTGHGAKLGRKAEQAIIALLTARNTEEAAKTVGVSTKTLMRWQKLPEFRKALRKARREALSQTIGRLQYGSSVAATALLKVVLDKDTPASTKVRASDSIINHALKAFESEDILERLEELERAMEETKNNRK